MSGDPLEGCRAKLARARTHEQSLEADWQTFLDRKPYTTIGEFDPQTGWHTERLQLNEEPPLELSVVFGDLIHNLRSTLDHLITVFVEANGKTAGKWNKFPAFEDWKRWADEIVGPESRGKLHPLAGIDPLSTAWTLIENVQPYRRQNPQYAPVAVLEWFWNVDKHRVLHGSYVALDVSSVDVRFHWSPDAGALLEEEFRLHTYDTLEDGAEVARLRFARPGPLDAGVYMDGDLPLSIRFGDGDTIVKDATVKKLREFVELVLQGAEQALDL